MSLSAREIVIGRKAESRGFECTVCQTYCPFIEERDGLDQVADHFMAHFDPSRLKGIGKTYQIENNLERKGN